MIRFVFLSEYKRDVSLWDQAEPDDSEDKADIHLENKKFQAFEVLKGDRGISFDLT